MTKKTSKSSSNTQADALSGEVSIRAHFDAKGLTVSGKSRALAAFDRLIGGFVGIAAEFFEDIRRRAELRGIEREQFIKSQSLLPTNLFSSLEKFDQVASQRFIAEETRKQLNREGVWIEAVKGFQDVSEPTDSTQEQNSETLEEDWINVFSAFAEKASSERLQQLWGRILSGQIRKPGSFALSTLRVISEMDVEIATAFQEIAAFRFAEVLLLKPKELSGDLLMKWTLLEEVGLLQDVSGDLSFNNTPKFKSDERPQRAILIHTGKYGVGVIVTSEIPNLSIPVVKITRVGQQISSILPWDELGAMRGIAVSIDENVGIEIIQKSSEYVDDDVWRFLELIKPAPTVPNVSTTQPI